ncbi:molybdopterin cofactor-binding domain-containing protein [uncultured Paracoccus sp.]|uniref:xanthine dehydrogenase family protein molybdopterin-binding subunit n=1 Tax=uncultured Paracoccus sp. TaxID=189685 RepID=UPI00262C059B|nr:molybdopterin cofactor-binding domain-containing protein [uncultured Paracoccus sp.]
MKMRTLPLSLQANPLLGQWLSLDTPGRLTISPGKVELGQGIASALMQIAAEELDLSFGRLTLRPVDTGASANEGITAGSQSVEVSGAALRLAAAQLRAALLDAAAVRLGVPVADLSPADGAILRKGAATGLDVWALADNIDWQQPISGEIAPKPAAEYTVVGTSLPRDDLPRKATTGGFIHDLTFPDLLHVRVVRQPFRLARLADLDEARLARRYPAVTAFRRDDFLALVGTDEHQVQSAHLESEFFTRWEDAGRWTPPETPGTAVLLPPEEDARPAPGNRRLSARYSRQSIAHGSIGPSCALAILEGEQLTVWSHSQGIFPLRAVIAKVLGRAVDSVRVIHADGAGCYGHNGADDAALDAALVAVAHPGRPVRVQFSRADELGRAPLGAAMATRIEAGLDAEGRIVDWQLSVTSAPHAQRPGFGGFANLTSAEALDPEALPRKVEDLPPASGGGASRNAVAIYDLPGQSVEVTLEAASPVRTSSLRALGAHVNVFAIESAMDELAALAGADPLAFRLAHLSDPRARAVLETAAQMAGWPDPNPEGTGSAKGLGVARYKNKGAWLAAVAEVTVDEAIRVEKLWLAVDAGLLINPEGARSQIEGGALQSLSWTLKEGIDLLDGRVPVLDWDRYPILRFSDVPEIETRFLINPNHPPLGAGEAAQGPVAAAIGNAVTRALGARMRDLPMTRERLMQSLLQA